MNILRKGDYSMKIGNYEFSYIQTIKPITENNGKIYKYKPQDMYNNKKGLELHKLGNGEFCKFKLEKAGNDSGVYAWVINGENKPIYIGETNNLKKRFNMGYGNISPRNCFTGGQFTNCKMNKVVLDYYNKGISIDIYFFKTTDYKNIEKELLNNIKTLYNSKNN